MGYNLRLSGDGVLGLDGGYESIKCIPSNGGVGGREKGRKVRCPSRRLPVRIWESLVYGGVLCGYLAVQTTTSKLSQDGDLATPLGDKGLVSRTPCILGLYI